ncbi:MAG: H-X9-DG-CTERM domain-containing protein [Hoylesella buccalis]
MCAKPRKKSVVDGKLSIERHLGIGNIAWCDGHVEQGGKQWPFLG